MLTNIHILDKASLRLKLSLKLSNAIQLIGRLSVEIVNLSLKVKSNLLYSRHLTEGSQILLTNRLRKRSGQTVNFAQTAIKEGYPIMGVTKLSLNYRRKRISRKARNQLSRSLPGGGMKPMIPNTGLEAVNGITQH